MNRRPCVVRILAGASLVATLLLSNTSLWAQDVMLERLLRTQVFNKAFEGFDFYHVTIEEDLSQSDGSREVTAVASGTFLDHVQRMKVLFLVVGDRVIGGQLLEGSGLPPCLAPEQSQSSL